MNPSGFYTWEQKKTTAMFPLLLNTKEEELKRCFGHKSSSERKQQTDLHALERNMKDPLDPVCRVEATYKVLQLKFIID